MGQEFAKCVRHNCLCRVPRVNLLFAVTSCKDFSKANPNKSKGQVLGKASSPGGSAQILNGLLAYLSKQVLDLLIFEHVDTLDEVSEHQNETSGGKEQTPLQGICSAFHAAGLRVLRVLTDAVLFGMPQHRRRYYRVAVKQISTLFDFGLWPCEYAFKRCRELLGLCVKAPPCMTEVMLGPDHSCLETALNYVLKDTYSVVSNNLKACYMFFPSLNPTTTFPELDRRGPAVQPSTTWDLQWHRTRVSACVGVWMTECQQRLRVLHGILVCPVCKKRCCCIRCAKRHQLTQSPEMSAKTWAASDTARRPQILTASGHVPRDMWLLPRCPDKSCG